MHACIISIHMIIAKYRNVLHCCINIQKYLKIRKSFYECNFIFKFISIYKFMYDFKRGLFNNDILFLEYLEVIS